MALLRLLCFQSTTHPLFCLTAPLTFLQKPAHSNTALCPPTVSLSLSLSSSLPSSISPITTTQPRLFLSPLLSSNQAQATTIETPELEESETVEEDDEASRTRLLAQNIPWTCTADDIRPLFEKYGTVVDIELSMYNKTRNRGLAFVSMSSPEEALAAFNNLESYEFEGRVMKLNWAKARKKKPSTPQQPKPVPIHNLFVANLPYQARARDLKEFFNSENANVVSGEIIFHDNPRRSAGYGFVSFNSKEEAEKALLAFQGKMFMGRSIRVALSRKFLREQTKLAIGAENTSTELNSDDNQTEKTDGA